MIKLADLEPNSPWAITIKNNIKAYGKSISKRKELVELLSEGNDIKRKFAYNLMAIIKKAKMFDQTCCYMESLEQYTHSIFGLAGSNMSVLLKDFEWAAFCISKGIRMTVDCVDINYTYQQVLDTLSSIDYWERVMQTLGFDLSDKNLVNIAKTSFEDEFDKMFNCYYHNKCKQEAA